MTESTPNVQATGAAPPAPGQPAPIDERTAERLQALRASRKQTAPVGRTVEAPPAKSKPTGPAPARIVAAAASISAGIGLMALMAGAQQDIVVQVNPAPVTVQPASIVFEVPENGNPNASEPRVVEAAVPAERRVPQARVVTQSEGS